MSDIYAEFGVNSAVIGGGTPQEHEQAMLEKDVSVRDGDDAITLDQPEADVETQVEEEEPQERQDEDQEEAEQDSEGDSAGADEDDFEAVGDTPAELVTASEELAVNEQGFHEMVELAISRGLSEDSVSRIQEEYSGDGLTDASYEELAQAGYSRSFVDSYLRGQEALVNGYVQGIVAYAGGQAKFDALVSHLQSADPSSADALVEAMEQRNLGMVKTIINLAAASRGKTFGKPAARSLTKRATPAAPSRAPQSAGFGSRAEMVKAMGDKRYGSDPAYRAEVERKVLASSF